MWNLAGEFDYGSNAVSLGNTFSASAPSDAFGIPSGPAINVGTKGNQFLTGAPLTGKVACSATTPATTHLPATVRRPRYIGQFYKTGGRVTSGSISLAISTFPIRGSASSDCSNGSCPTTISLKIRSTSNASLLGSLTDITSICVAVDSQNISYYHNQFGIPVGTAEGFNYAPGNFNGRQLPSIKTFTIPNLVPTDTHSVFANVEFSYYPNVLDSL